jgi:chitodextrinase
MKTTTLYRIIEYSLFIFISVHLAQAQDPRPKIECGCTKYGDYTLPAVKALLVEESEIIKEGYSSEEDPEYIVSQESAAPPNLVTLSICRGDALIFTQTNTAIGWGFSPDQDRFIMHGFTSDRKFWWTLVNLDPDPSVEGEPVVVYDPIITSLKTSSANLAFSPHGKYIVTASILELEGRLLIDVYRTKDREKVYSYTTNSIIGPAVRKGSAGWGFSPDAKDATFIFSFLVNVNQYALYAINLMKESDQYIFEAPSVDNTLGYATFSFSPCGEYFAWRYENLSSAPMCRLYKTNAQNIFEEISAVDFVKIYASADGHFIEYLDGHPYKIADNTADNDCPDREKPLWKEEDKMLDTILVQGVRLQLEWEGDSDYYGVTSYKIFVSDDQAQPLKEYLYNELDEKKPVKKYTVTGLNPETEYIFKVEAGDDAGYWSNDGPEKKFSTFPDNPPYWPVQTLNHKGTTETKVTLYWDEPAIDDYGIMYYEIITNFEEDTLIRVGGDKSECTIKKLTPGQEYTFRIEAIDEAGQRVIGPAHSMKMPERKAPEWPAGASLTCSDSTETSLKVNWPEAIDEFNAVEKYTIIMEGDSLTTVNNYSLSYEVKDLEEGTAYNFSVIAYDESDNPSPTLNGLLSTIPTFTADTLFSGPGNQKTPDIDDKMVV